MAASSAGFETSLWKAMIQRRTVLVAMVILSIVALAALLAPWVALADPGALAVRNRLTAPGAEYWLGSDEYGRDILSRLIYAGRISLIVGLGVALLSSVIGIVLGLLGGTFRKLDGPVSRIIDAMMAFPDILLAIALVAALGASVFNVILALAIVYSPRIARIVRASAIVIRELPYVEAARALGVSTPRILVHHMLRNMASPIIVQATFVVAYAMLAEAGLSFLGVGVDPDTPTWGTMINAGIQYRESAMWMIVFPGIAITLCVLALQVAGDGLRDALDPRISKEL